MQVTYTLNPIPTYVVGHKVKVLIQAGGFSCVATKIGSMCVYLQIPRDHPWASITDPEEIRIRASYGTATYASFRFPLEGTSYSLPANVPADGFWIGWDYQNVEDPAEQADLIYDAVIRVIEDINAAAKPISTALDHHKTVKDSLFSEPAESYMEEVD